MSTNNENSKKTKISKNIREDGPAAFNYEKERARACFGNPVNENLYNEADRLQEQYIFDLEALKPEKQLDCLAKEVKVRVKITQQEIFRIGELLCRAKKICKEQRISFKKWIEQSFDFSYETANNFKNVYKQCFGRISVAEKLPPSILYKLSAPNFPDRLREYLFDNANLEDMTNGRLERLVEKYKKEGMEAIEDDIEDLRHGMLIGRQTSYMFDQFENALRTLDALRQKMNSYGKESKFSSIENDAKYQTDEAKEINLTLYDAIEDALKQLNRAKKDSIEILNDYLKEVESKHMSSEWKKEYDYPDVDTESIEEQNKKEAFEAEFQT